MRLDRFLANSGYGTRSDIRSVIRAGRVSVNGRAIKDPAFSSFDEKDASVTIDGEPVNFSRYLYIAMNKPDEFITAMEDARLHTVAELLPEEFLGKGVAPVGRLDYHTTGFLLITNNGVLSHRLTSPKWHAEKIYLVTYDGLPLTEAEKELFSSGMTLSENGHEPTKLAPAVLDLLGMNTCRLHLTEGKSHQVKRMLAQVNRPVLSLHRESVGDIGLLPTQRPGDYRLLDVSEVKHLFEITKLDQTLM